MVWIGALLAALLVLALALGASDAAPSTYEIGGPVAGMTSGDAVTGAAPRPCYRPENPFAPAELKCQSAGERDALLLRRRAWLAAAWSCVVLAVAFAAFPVWATWTWFGARATPLPQSARD